MERRILLTKHVAERMLEQNVTLGDIRKNLRNGVRIEDRLRGTTYCVYKKKDGVYHTLVVQEESRWLKIITTYESSQWQIEQYRTVKKHERSKMH